MLRGIRPPTLMGSSMPAGRIGNPPLLSGLLPAGGPALEQLKREAGQLRISVRFSNAQTHKGLVMPAFPILPVQPAMACGSPHQFCGTLKYVPNSSLRPFMHDNNGSSHSCADRLMERQQTSQQASEALVSLLVFISSDF